MWGVINRKSGLHDECGHENYVRYINNLLIRDEFVTMESLTQSKRKQKAAGPGRPAAARGRLACLTLEDIQFFAKERREKRAKAKSAADTNRKRFLRAAFSSPSREAEEAAAKRSRTEEERRNDLLAISKELESANEQIVTKALHLCKDFRVSLQEAKLSRFGSIGSKVIQIKKNRSTSANVIALAKWLEKHWVLQKVS